VGRVTGHRGGSGELTVRVFGGDASLWTQIPRVWIGNPGGATGRFYGIDRSRSYRDRLVLKLGGVEGPGEAAALRGREVWVPESEAPRLPEGVYYNAELVGMEVEEETGLPIGRVREVIATGGTDLLAVDRASDASGIAADGEPEEMLIPMARSIVLEVSREARRIRVRLPEGLADLNRGSGERGARGTPERRRAGSRGGRKRAE
jgi:16S rRNA processing protein RimM